MINIIIIIYFGFGQVLGFLVPGREWIMQKPMEPNPTQVHYYNEYYSSLVV